MTIEELKEMKLHETFIDYGEGDSHSDVMTITIVRVFNGWMYHCSNPDRGITFNEFVPEVNLINGQVLTREGTPSLVRQLGLNP